MSCSKVLQFCINHSFLLNSSDPKIYDDQFIDKIKEIQPQLKQIFDYYQTYSDKSIETIKKLNEKETMKNFVVKLSQYLNLACDVCYSLLKSFLCLDKQLKDEDLQSVLSRGYNTISLMQNVKRFYIEERLSLIRLIRYVFCDWKDELLVLSAIVFDGSNFETKKDIFLKLLETYKSLVNDINKDRSSFDCGDSTEDEFLTQSFNEQVELLETLLIGAYSLRDCQERVLWDSTVRLFVETGFCADFPGLSRIFISRPFFKSISDRIGLLQSLILIELASINSVINDEKHHLFESGKMDKSLSDLKMVVMKFGARAPHSILLLFMSIIQPEFCHDTDKMAELAIMKMDLFGFVSSVLTTKPYSISVSEGSYLGLITHCVLFDLFSLVCHKIHLNSLDNHVRDSLVKVMCLIIKPIIEFSDIHPLNGGFMKLLEDLSMSFPLNLGMLNVIGCLMKKKYRDGKEVERLNENIVWILSEFMDNLQWFCDDRCIEMKLISLVPGEGSGDDLNNRNAAKLYQLNQKYYPYDGIHEKSQLVFGVGQRGYLTNGGLMFPMNYSVWDVIASEVLLTCRMITFSNDNHARINRQLDRFETILEFLSIALENNLKKDMIIKMFSHVWCLIENDSFYIEHCEPALIKLINLTGQILSVSKDFNLLSRIVSAKNLFPNAQASFDEKVFVNPSVIENAWIAESNPVNIGIVRAYLKFNVNLIQCEKMLETEVGIVPSTLIYGSINFVIRSVFNNINKQTFSNNSAIVNLAADCLIFLNEIMSMKPKSYSLLSEARKCRLELIQEVSHEVLVDSPTCLKTILSLSSMDIEILLKESNLSNRMLAIHGTENKFNQIVWMSLTLIKYIFVGPESMNEELLDKGASVILKLLDTNDNDSVCSLNSIRKRRVNTYSQQYVLRLMEFLSYPYSIKISRMALDVLKLIIRSTNISIVACLGEKTPLIRDVLLQILDSNMEDQIVRANLFQFLGECVMCGRPGVLQLIGPNEGSVSSCYKSSIDIITNCKLDDEVSVKLICSVSKFLSSLWIKECYSSIECLKKLNFWSTILTPLKHFMKESGFVLKNQSLSARSVDQLFEYVGNVYGLFGMELYSCSGSPKSDKDSSFVKSLNELLSVDLFIGFLDVFDKDYLGLRSTNSDEYLKLLLPPITWWKTVLVTVLSLCSNDGGELKVFSLADLINLTTNLCQSILNLSSVVHSQSSDLNIVIDHLSSSILEIIHTKSKYFSSGQFSVILDNLTEVLSHLLSSSSVVFHIRHTDLLAAAVLLLHNYKTNSAPEIIQKVTENYLLILTSKSTLTKLETKALIQAINLCLTLSRSLDDKMSLEWASDLADTGILQNCLVLLSDSIQHNDLSLLPQTLMQLFIRLAHTSLGASRLLQSFLLPILHNDVIIDETDHNSILFLAQILQLTGILLTRGGSSANEFALRTVLVFWDKINSLINQGCQKITNLVNIEDFGRIELLLTIGQYSFDVVYNLLEIRGTWSLYWPVSLLRELELLIHLCTNAVAAVLSQPQQLFLPNSAHILLGKIRHNKQVSFITHSPKVKQEHSVSVEDAEQPLAQHKNQIASIRLESSLYRLLLNSLLLYSRSTCIVTEDILYQGMAYEGALLSEDFSDNRLDNSRSPISFGCLFSIVNSTHFLLRDDIAPLIVDKEKIYFNSDLMRQIHEIALSTIVSHAINYLSKFDSSCQFNKNTFVSNLRSELNYYLNEFAKTRRRNTLSSSSPHSTGPKFTSTPYARKSAGIGEGFDGFCAGIDCFRKALDLM